MVAMSVTLVCSRLSGELGIALTEALFWRQLLPMLAILAWLTARGELARLRTDRFWIHARRAVIGTVGMFMTLGVARMMPLAEATIMGFTAPIFAVILATVLLRESVGPWRWGAVLLGLVGVLVIVGPTRPHLPLDGVGVGLGAAKVNIFDFRDNNQATNGAAYGLDASKWNVAWALHAGVAYEVSSNLKLELSYRYVHLGDGTSGDLITYQGTNNVNNPMLFKDITSQDIRLGFRWMLECCDTAPPPPPVVYQPPVYQPPPLMRRG